MKTEAPDRACILICDSPAGIRSCELRLRTGATLTDAVTAARGLLGADLVRWDSVAVGVWGQRLPRDYVIQPGDRVEIYRQLIHDPRDARRTRAGAKGKRHRP